MFSTSCFLTSFRLKTPSLYSFLPTFVHTFTSAFYPLHSTSFALSTIFIYYPFTGCLSLLSYCVLLPGIFVTFLHPSTLFTRPLLPFLLYLSTNLVLASFIFVAICVLISSLFSSLHCFLLLLFTLSYPSYFSNLISFSRFFCHSDFCPISTLLFVPLLLPTPSTFTFTS